MYNGGICFTYSLHVHPSDSFAAGVATAAKRQVPWSPTTFGMTKSAKLRIRAGQVKAEKMDRFSPHPTRPRMAFDLDVVHLPSSPLYRVNQRTRRVRPKVYFNGARINARGDEPSPSTFNSLRWSRQRAERPPSTEVKTTRAASMLREYRQRALDDEPVEQEIGFLDRQALRADRTITDPAYKYRYHASYVASDIPY